MDRRRGLNELVNERIYPIDVTRPLESAIVELWDFQDANVDGLTNEQEGLREQICTCIWQDCKTAVADFSLDDQVDKQTFKQGREAAKYAAKLNLRERLPEMDDNVAWAKRRQVVDADNARGGCLGYWDHLPTHLWMPMFSNQFKEQAYK